ncbi:glycosyltransferase family 4 protein [Clostridium nigeriense]|uniref:glycosyltransferase family 4 protein n=1 Tax=Clostridium nigeriense TaxID=1805470 RepID=UPI003D34F152
MKKKIAIIGQFPPPIHGLSKALDTLYNSYLNEEFDFTKIDITNNKNFFNNLIKILFSKLDLYYLTISQSKFGNIRDLIMIKLIQLKKRKIIIHLHGGGFRNILDNEFSNYQRKRNYKILSKVDAAIVLGDSLRYIFEGIIPKDKIYVVKNCVDDEVIISDEEFDGKISALESKKELKILYLSNFIEDKGYKEVLKLATLVKEKKDNRFKFVFAGKFFYEDDKKEFFKYIKANNLEEIIEYRGIIYGEKKTNTLKECDYAILLTRYKNEGQPISIIEAMANGLGIIATNHAGIKDILISEKNILIDKNDINIEKIYLQLINNYTNKKSLCEQIIINRINTVTNFSEVNYLRDLYNIYNIL